MKTTVLVTAAAGTLLAITSSAMAQRASVVNPGFELGRITNPAIPRDWRVFNNAVRRFPGDGLTPALPAIRPGGSGTAMVELRPGFDFVGLDTNVFIITDELYNDLIYQYGCGPMTASMWYFIPTNASLAGRGVDVLPNGPFGQNGGLKLEFRRPNQSVYFPIEELDIAGNTGGQWVQKSMTITQADWDFYYNLFNGGQPWAELPVTVSILPFRFGGPSQEAQPGALYDPGTIFVDDIAYSQNLGGPNETLEFYDDREVIVVAKNLDSITEPAVPLFFNNIRQGWNCLPGDDNFKLVEIYDRVPSTAGTPQVIADIIANGYVRPTVQRSNGTTTPFGTSVVSQPAIRPQSQPLDTVPDFTRADANVTFLLPLVPGGPLRRADPLEITGTGSFGALGSIVSTRNYPDPAVGVTQFSIDYTFTAAQSITLQGGPTGRGFDAFRLVWFSSMLANLAGGQYDANYIAVESPTGQKRTLAIADAPRNTYLFGAPQPTSVGRAFTLYKDTAATWNPGSASIEIEIVSLTLNGGAAGSLGVQGFLAGTTDPNDDSLSVWLEWTGAPTTIPAGSVIQAQFLVTATPATALGDADHDGSIDCDDVAILNSLIGQNTASPTFNAFVDMNKDGSITAADRTLLQAITGPCGASCPGDTNGDNLVNGADLSVLLGQFNQSVPPNTGADFNGDGLVNGADLSVLLGRFNTAC